MYPLALPNEDPVANGDVAGDGTPRPSILSSIVPSSKSAQYGIPNHLSGET